VQLMLIDSPGVVFVFRVSQLNVTGEGGIEATLVGRAPRNKDKIIA
jgi:hypothetical protein